MKKNFLVLGMTGVLLLLSVSFIACKAPCTTECYRDSFGNRQCGDSECNVVKAVNRGGSTGAPGIACQCP